MGIEQTLERIAVGIESIAESLLCRVEQGNHMVKIVNEDAQDRKKYREGKNGQTSQAQTSPAQTSPAQTSQAQTAQAQTAQAQTAQAQTAPAQTAPAQTSSDDGKPGYEELKAKLIARGVDVPKGTKYPTLEKLWNSLPKEDAKMETPEADDIFGDLAPETEEVMTMEECRKRITALCATGVPDANERTHLATTLSELGVRTFAELPQEKYASLVEKFKAAAGK